MSPAACLAPARLRALSRSTAGSSTPRPHALFSASGTIRTPPAAPRSRPVPYCLYAIFSGLRRRCRGEGVRLLRLIPARSTFYPPALPREPAWDSPPSCERCRTVHTGLPARPPLPARACTRSHSAGNVQNEKLHWVWVRGEFGRINPFQIRILTRRTISVQNHP